jgi:hypothetical protein
MFKVPIGHPWVEPKVIRKKNTTTAVADYVQRSLPRHHGYCEDIPETSCGFGTAEKPRCSFLIPAEQEARIDPLSEGIGESLHERPKRGISLL